MAHLTLVKLDSCFMKYLLSLLYRILCLFKRVLPKTCMQEPPPLYPPKCILDLVRNSLNFLCNLYQLFSNDQYWLPLPRDKALQHSTLANSNIRHLHTTTTNNYLCFFLLDYFDINCTPIPEHYSTKGSGIFTDTFITTLFNFYMVLVHVPSSSHVQPACIGTVLRILCISMTIMNVLKSKYRKNKTNTRTFNMTLNWWAILTDCWYGWL